MDVRDPGKNVSRVGGAGLFESEVQEVYDHE
jgi:hypothetical protein